MKNSHSFVLIVEEFQYFGLLKPKVIGTQIAHCVDVINALLKKYSDRNFLMKL